VAPPPRPLPPDIPPKMLLDSASVKEWYVQRKIDVNTRIDKNIQNNWRIDERGDDEIMAEKCTETLLLDM
jgi:hypothetical protein